MNEMVENVMMNQSTEDFESYLPSLKHVFGINLLDFYIIEVCPGFKVEIFYHLPLYQGAKLTFCPEAKWLVNV